MQPHELVSIFDKSAPTYDQHGAKLAPLRDALYYLLDAVLAGLPDHARILCVGVGTGLELIELAQRHPGWRFTAVEPSVPMLDICRQKAEAAGVADRCVFHPGYLESLPVAELFDAATALLVSQFILDSVERTGFFCDIGKRLRPGGLLVSSDLASDTRSEEYPRLLEVWWRIMQGPDARLEGLERMRANYDRDVAVLPPADVAEILARGGFEAPVLFLQTGLIHAWFARHVPS